MASVSDQAWVRWWCEAWQDAHGSWQTGFAEHVGLALSACAQLARRQPEPFMCFTGMTAPQPPEPDANTLQWLALQPAQRQLALALVAQICAPDRSSTVAIDEHAPWCRSLAKALRPGLWLETLEPGLEPALKPGTEVGVGLLRPWIGPHCWTRLRLDWPMPLAKAAEQGMKVNASAPGKLRTLWPAVLWRVSAGRQNIPEVSDAG
jgi:hypothetical protein